MRRYLRCALVGACLAAGTIPASAQPTFVNGLVIPGGTLDATRQPGANAGRFGFFSDLYYDTVRDQWWAISDRGPGGGVLEYQTRVQRIGLDVDKWTGRISRFKVLETVKFSDPRGLLFPHLRDEAGEPLNGLNPLALNGNAGVLGRSFDPEGLVIDPRTGHFLVSDEYGPSVYEFNRKGRLVRVFETPANLIPAVGATVNYVADRAGGATAGRQDNRGFEGLAISPDGTTLYAVLQDPVMDEPGPNNGRDGRNVRIVVFDNDRRSRTYATSIAQYVYQLEPQAAVAARIVAAGGVATGTDPRQGRNIGLSAIVAINDHEFFVLERDNRGIGVDDPAGANIVGSKQVFRIDIRRATDVAGIVPLPNDLAGITPVAKSAVVLDLAAQTLLPNGKRAEKWEGLTIGPRLRNGAHVIVAGNDNDYSVTQDVATSVQFDVFVDFKGGFVRRDLDQPTRLEGVDVGPVPDGYSRLPGVLHAYRASAADLRGYVEPDPGRRPRDGRDDDRDDDHRDEDDRR